MKKIYIAGKVTDLQPSVVTAKFQLAESSVIVAGFEAVNPVKVVNNSNENWETAMKKCIVALMKCDAVLALPCVWHSKGAQIERELAKNVNMPIFYTLKELEAWNN